MKNPVTHAINEKALEIIGNTPEGVRWTDLLKELEKYNPSWHPKTINGCVWKLVEKYPSEVYKPEKGLFRLDKYKN